MNTDYLVDYKIKLNKKNRIVYKTKEEYYKSTNEIINEQNNLLKKYSENYNGLMNTLKDCEIFFTYNRIRNDFIKNRQNVLLQIDIERNNKEISFDYTLSAMDSTFILWDDLSTNYKIKMLNNLNAEYNSYRQRYIELKKVKAHILYNILCSSRLDYHIPENFNDFCYEFGYNNDSIKDLNIFNKCLEQSRKLKIIFDEKEIEDFPS